MLVELKTSMPHTLNDFGKCLCSYTTSRGSVLQVKTLNISNNMFGALCVPCLCVCRCVGSVCVMCMGWTVQKVLFCVLCKASSSVLWEGATGKLVLAPAALFHANGFLMAPHSRHTFLYLGQTELFREGKPHFLILNIYYLWRKCVHMWAHIYVFSQFFHLAYVCVCL